ncbi:endonuclease/exonuclease/phosphatase family protein [Streptomonospora nanhaiensis]|uniref:Endonuclease/exonuclease/phosphatase family metal-dependent hydrolase n=1 Tax=Streptomonospora nanhaiensis TaxID=1323731 RepID=A0A853BUW5_9ACTN|nr:endonuclease/exonuclease/phosphatase family protein [Streptomonospora nanhaiensis]MBV2366194.1 endonuclease/exonuclease/phosphatase family protein [Streptomonospora nanhaiensis]NYI98291.1 endonuclease/exonuclease/phosphatase family metal-dependent hydrolase [Streptomonospora nanhaiensis]
MALKIMSLNIQHGGILDPAGNPDDRWPDLAKIINRQRPDILLLQELMDWDRHLYAQLYRAQADLAMMAAGLTWGRAGGGGGTFYRPDTVTQVGWADKFSRELYAGLGVALFAVPGLPERLTVVNTHLTTVGPEAAVPEAMRAADRVVRYSPYGVLAGDINVHPLCDGGQAPDPSTVKPLDYAARWTADGEPDRRVATGLYRAGLVDVADYIARRTGNQAHYAATGHGGIRVDQAHVTRALVPMLVGYERIDTGDASDHDGFVVTVDPAAAGRADAPVTPAEEEAREAEVRAAM